MPDTARLTTALAGRYRIEREIGAGGMATVYLARDLKHDREVALKVLRPELGAVLGSERFLSEIRISARLDHPHILTLIDSGESDTFLWYVLPFVRGESLRDLLNREKQLGLDQALTIARQVAGALDYAHRQGVVHRDIKPENILIQEGEAMLADFGIALAVKEAGGNRLTETGLSLGTPQYMSPEQATGDRTLDARSDVYSLGAVLYEMLAGEPPVTGPTVQAVIAKLLTERPTQLRVVRDTVPEAIDTAVAKALAKVPADRFRSAAEFQNALQVGPATVPDRRRRPRWMMPAAALAVLALLALGATLLKPGGAPAAAISLPRTQLTFTGNARYPSLSPDGRRLAYAVRQCDAQGRCTSNLVIEDLGGAGAATLVRGLGALWDIEWTADGRYLMFDGSFGSSRWGAFSVPTLGGTVRYLGCCGGDLVQGSDTAIVVSPVAAGDSAIWLRLINIVDGTTADSTQITGTFGEVYASVLPDRAAMAVWLNGPSSVTIRTTDRRGVTIDSLRFSGDRRPVGADVSGSGRDLLLFFDAGAQAMDVVRYPLGTDHRISNRPDTLARQLTIGGAPEFGPTGELVFHSGPTDFSLWAMSRRDPHSLSPAQRQLAASTAPLSGSINEDGDQVLIVRTVVQGERRLRQFSVMPFDSGPETPVGTPLDHVMDWDWAGAGRVMLAQRRPERDVVELSFLDVRTGRATGPRATIPAGEYLTAEGVGDSGIVLFVNGGRTLRRYGLPGLHDTVLSLPASAGQPHRGGVSPDGRAIATVGWDLLYDSILVNRISLVDGSTVRLAVFSGEGYDTVRWLPDGTLQFGINETAGTAAWYRMSASGGPPVRLGPPPRSSASFRLSRDGRRVLARAAVERPDAYMIRSFSSLLQR